MTKAGQVNRRIRKIRMRLTPKEAFLVWLKGLPDFVSATQFLSWFHGDSLEGSSSFSLICSEVTKAVTTAMVGETWGDVEAAVTEAQRMVHFMYSLCVGLNFHVLSEQFYCAEKCLVLIPAVGRMLEHGKLLRTLQKSPLLTRTRSKPSVGKPGEAVQAVRNAAKGLEAEFAELRKELESLMGRVFETRQVVDRINKEFFDGHLALWRNAAEFVNKPVSESSVLRPCHDQLKVAIEFMRTGGVAVSDLNLERMKRGVEPRVNEAVSRLLAMAKVEALRRLGKHQDGRELWMDYLRNTAQRKQAS